MRGRILLATGLALLGCGQSGTGEIGGRPVVGPNLQVGTLQLLPGYRAPAQLAQPDLSVQNVLQSPTRIAVAEDGRIYVSDYRVGSVFVMEENLKVVSEFKNLDRPVGVGVDAAGNLYVSSEGRRQVEKYAPSGQLLWVFPGISVANDIKVDRQGRLYAADSANDVIRVYSPQGEPLGVIGGPGEGDGKLRFPMAFALYEPADGPAEIYVGDMLQQRVEVFALDGTFLRAWGDAAEAFSTDWQGRLQRTVSMAFDAFGRLHVLDGQLATVQIFERDGSFVAWYGKQKPGEGELDAPASIALLPSGKTAVVNLGSRRVVTIARGRN